MTAPVIVTLELPPATAWLLVHECERGSRIRGRSCADAGQLQLTALALREALAAAGVADQTAGVEKIEFKESA